MRPALRFYYHIAIDNHFHVLNGGLITYFGMLKDRILVLKNKKKLLKTRVYQEGPSHISPLMTELLMYSYCHSYYIQFYMFYTLYLFLYGLWSYNKTDSLFFPIHAINIMSSNTVFQANDDALYVAGESVADTSTSSPDMTGPGSPCKLDVARSSPSPGIQRDR